MIGYYPVCNTLKYSGMFKPHYYDPLYTQSYRMELIKENLLSMSSGNLYKELKKGGHWGKGMDFEEYSGKGIDYRYSGSGTTNMVLEDNIEEIKLKPKNLQQLKRQDPPQIKMGKSKRKIPGKGLKNKLLNGGCKGYGLHPGGHFGKNGRGLKSSGEGINLHGYGLHPSGKGIITTMGKIGVQRKKLRNNMKKIGFYGGRSRMDGMRRTHTCPDGKKVPARQLCMPIRGGHGKHKKRNVGQNIHYLLDRLK